MSHHPYRALPAKAFWKRSVAEVAPDAIDPVGRFDLRIDPGMKIATAGSCFAQHIARHLEESGFTYHVAERAHPLLADLGREHGYGIYSARYGNIYTSRQLRQLVDRALGHFVPADDCWRSASGAFIDPFRPSAQPGGFKSEAEMRADRRQHLACVRSLFADLDVFVFTLGLTEAWLSVEDGAVYPICPGVEGGSFDPERYRFVNLGVQDVIDDMAAFLADLRELNPGAQIILTVSPVPLAATAETDEHVLTATTYSKSVLRVAAGMLRDAHANVHYFPSYEIITAQAARGRYYLPDLRNVTEDGVRHVMRVFLARATSASPEAPLPRAAPEQDRLAEQMSEFVEVLCDEEKLDSEG